MADSQHLHLQGNTRLREAQAKSFARYFGKFLFLALFLIAIPMFPAQAPDFVNQTILTKFWELVHLLFIGVAVSYGLFCRRNVDVDFETQQPTTDDSQSYVSRVFPVSSLFEDENHNYYSYGYGEKNVGQTLYSDNWKDESFVDGSSETSVVSEQSKNRSLNHGIGYENLHAFGENNTTQAWNNQYFRGESMVVVDQPNYAVNEYGESGLRMTQQPLGLPVRSLRSRMGSQDSLEISNGSESSSVLTDSSHSPSNHEHVNEQFGDLGPLNLEKKFNETSGLSSPTLSHSRFGKMEIRENGVIGTHPLHFRPLSVDETQLENKLNETSGLSSPIPWRLSSGRMEIRGNGGIGTHASHFRPLSVDETQFESLKSQSFWSTESFSSPASSISDSPSRLSLSGTDSSELDDTGKDKSFLRSTYPPASSPLNGKTSLNALRIRKYTSGSLFEKKTGKSSEANLKDRSASKREDPLGSKELRSGSLKFNEKPASLVKAYSRGKSVRSRARGYAVEAMKDEERSRNRIKNIVGKAAHDEIETVYEGKDEMKNGVFDNLSPFARKQDVVNYYPMPKPALSEIQPKPALSEIQPKPALSEIQPKPGFSEIQKRKNRERSEDFAVVSREESESEVENFQVKSDEEAVTNHVNNADPGFDPNEVDKKAGEFIAKFREQIRLQKMASIDKSKGLNHFR